LMNCIQFSADAGIGVSAHVQVGPAGIGTGVWGGWSVGLDGESKEFGVWNGWSAGFPFVNLGFIFLVPSVDYALSTGVTVLYWKKNGAFAHPRGSINYLIFTDYSPEFESHRGKENITHWSEFFWITASLRCMVGVKFGVNLIEILDFILGWFGIDICGDDR